MIQHFFIAVENPSHVASVFAEIMKAQIIPFPPHAGSYMVVACDEYATVNLYLM